jgi:hypothetical protein
VLDAASPRRDAAIELDLSVNERAARAAARQRLCALVRGSLVPALEGMVRQDYGMWAGGGAGGAAAASAPAASSASASAASASATEGGLSPSEQVGGEKVEALARCYAFLVECGGLGWPAVEALATAPYSPALFWRQANAAYRHFALFLLAHVLANAPGALAAPPCAAAALRVWVLALADTGRRGATWYLTQVLSANPATAVLFEGAPPRELDVRGDAAGEARAALAGRVVGAAAMSAQWRPQLCAVLGDLDDVLAARRREIEATAFNPAAAALRWEAAASRVVAAVVAGAAPVLDRHPSGRPGAGGPDPGARQVKALLSRCAGWAAGACAALHRAHAAARAAAAAAPGDALAPAADDNDDDLAAAVQTVAEVRQSLRASPFAALPSLWRVLLDAGAPAALDADPALLHPLWAAVSGCLEAGTGEVEPTPVDEVVAQMLAASLAPAPPEPAGTEAEAEAGAAAAAAAPSQRLLCYVLSTFVRRYLTRSSLRHASHERAAVNAVRLAQAVLAQPCMRGARARDAALAALLRPLLEVLAPARGAAPSAGAKEAVYRLLGSLVLWHPEVVPPRGPAPADPRGMPAALHTFWLAVGRDAVGCVAGVLQPEARQKGMQALEQRCAGGAFPGALRPATPATVAEASNALLGALGRPGAGLEAVERAFAGFVPAPAPGLFRPGDFQWELARRAMGLVGTLLALPAPAADGGGGGAATEAAAGLAPGAQWAMACFPALHYVILGAGPAGRPLLGAYRSLRERVQAALGAGALAPFPIKAAAPRQQGPAAPAPPPPQHFLDDQTLETLRAAPPGSVAPVTACVGARPQRQQVRGGAAATLALKDLSGARASVVVSQPAEVVAALLALGEAREWRPAVVRFAQLRVAPPAVQGQPAGAHALQLFATPLSALEVDPAGERADALRAAFAQAGEAPLQHALESQATQGAGPPALPPPPAGVAVKEEPQSQQQDDPAPRPAAGGQELFASLRAAKGRLLGMGYSGPSATAALKAVAQRHGATWRAYGAEQLVEAALQCIER